MQLKKGYVYILTNPSFREDWVKIGSSREVNVRSKELYNTAVPLPFEIYATIKTSKYIELEQYIHDTLTNLANRRINEKREFFNIKPEDALAHIKKLVELIPDAEINSPDTLNESKDKSTKRTLNYKGKYIVKVSPNVKFYFMRDSVDATMIVKNGNRFIVKKGSHIDPKIYSNKSVVLSLRKKSAKSLIKNKTINDIEFASPSSAGVFVCGGACNGKYYWRTKEGKTLNDFIKYNK